MKMRREVALVALVALVGAIVACVAPGFFAPAHLRGLLLDRLPILVGALGMTCVIASGQIDVAVGAELALLSALLGTLAKLGLPFVVTIPLTLLAGVALGALHAGLIAVLRAPALLVTLATLGIVREGLRLHFGGTWILDLPGDFPWFGLGQERGGTLCLAAGAALALLFAGILAVTRTGRSWLAVGGDPHVAGLLGVRVHSARTTAFLALGFAMGCAALLHATRFPTIETEVGLGYELEVIACVVVGGANPNGGRASITGTCAGWLLFAVLGSMLVFLHVDPAWEKAVAGLALVLGVAADTLFAAREVHRA